MAKPHAFVIPGIGTASRTDFLAVRPEYGEFLIWDYYANNTATNVVKVQAVKKSYFVIDGDIKVSREDGKAIGFETAIVRRDEKQARKLNRKTAEKRLEFYDYNTLPGKVLRQLNAVLDEHEISMKLLRERYAISKQNVVIADSSERFRGKAKKFKSDATPAPRKSVLEDPPKATWGRRKSRSDD